MSNSQITVRRYGIEYPATIIRSTATRHFVSWTYKNGVERTAWINRADAPTTLDHSDATCRCGKTPIYDANGNEQWCPNHCERATWNGSGHDRF